MCNTCVLRPGPLYIPQSILLKGLGAAASAKIASTLNSTHHWLIVEVATMAMQFNGKELLLQVRCSGLHSSMVRDNVRMGEGSVEKI